jgi:hypothetical protein
MSHPPSHLSTTLICQIAIMNNIQAHIQAHIHRASVSQLLTNKTIRLALDMPSPVALTLEFAEAGVTEPVYEMLTPWSSLT